jgi:tRNA threonylcarbamoyladenosine biosynthesis protein TsaB
MILCIETATSVCSVALCDGSGYQYIRESTVDRSHASKLTPFIEELFAEAKITANKLDAIAVSKGPGSYTGLRIGVSVAKGIAYGAGIPLIGVGTLESMFHGIADLLDDIPGLNKGSLFCPMIDAKRMEVYSTLFDISGKQLNKVKAEIIEPGSYNEILEKKKIVFFGNGAVKCREHIKHPAAIFIEDFALSSKYMCKPAAATLKTGEFEDIAYFEPFYLKDFIATIPRKSILGR